MEHVLQGNIGRFTLPEIFQLIANSCKTGTLGIQKDDDIVMIYFKKGQIIYGYGPRQNRHLGQLLKDNGKITSEQLNEAVDIQSRKNVSSRLGQILIERGFIANTDLELVVKDQVEELIYSLLGWETGSFKFYDDQYPTREEIVVNLSVENVILEGVRRLDEVNRVKEVLPDFDTVLEISGATPGRRRDISLQPEEWNLMAMIDGHRTINEITRSVELPKIQALEKLAAMKLAGLISISTKKNTETDRLAGMVDRVAGLLEQYLAHRTRDISVETTTTELVGEEDN